MSELLAGKVALVTGGDRGIGTEICKAFVREGVSVLYVGYRFERAKAGEVICEVNQMGTNLTEATTIEADITTTKGRNSFFNKLDVELGRLGSVAWLDIAVNAAGLRRDACVKQDDGVTRHDWVPLKHTEFMESLFMIVGEEALRMRDGGRIINLTNCLKVPRDEFAAVATENTIAAINDVTVEMAHRLHSRQITVNSVSPGPEGAEPGAWIQAIEHNPVQAHTPYSRLGSAKGVADAVVAFASPPSKWITGTTVWSMERKVAIPR